MVSGLVSKTVHFPTLKTVMAIEAAIKNSSSPISKNQIIASMPTKVMRSTLNVALDYLQKKEIILETNTGFVWVKTGINGKGEIMGTESKILDEKEMIEGYKKTAKLSLEISNEWEFAEKEANRFLDDY